MLSVTPIPALSDNYIWLLRQDTSPGVCVVDPGDAEPVIQLLEQKNLNLETILITHHHGDHTAGLPALIERYSPHVIGPDNPDIQGLTQRVGDGDSCQVMGRRFDVYAVPGHTLDHIAFFTPGIPPLLFCGDTLFAAGCGKLFEGTADMMYTSLQRFASLPAHTQVYCAHEYTLSNLRFAMNAEPDNSALHDRMRREQQRRDLGIPTLPSTILSEQRTNPFLRCHSDCLQHAVTSWAIAQNLESPDNERETFALLRRWKDQG